MHLQYCETALNLHFTVICEYNHPHNLTKDPTVKFLDFLPIEKKLWQFSFAFFFNV
jgi:hypothetical protein